MKLIFLIGDSIRMGYCEAVKEALRDRTEPLTSLEEYRKNLQMILWTLKNFFPKAQILLATTTPMNPAAPYTVNPRSTEEIVGYNRVVWEVAREHGLPVNDLFALGKDWGEERYLDDCHMTREGYRRLAEQVTEAVCAYI